MPSIGVLCPRGRISNEECRACALNPLRPCNYTPDLLSEIRGDTDSEPDGLTHTPTRVMGCARRAVLEASNDYYTDVRKAYFAVRGNMIHGLFERMQYPGVVDVVREVRLSTPIRTKDGPREYEHFFGKSDALVVLAIDERPWADEDAELELAAHERWRQAREVAWFKSGEAWRNAERDADDWRGEYTPEDTYRERYMGRWHLAHPQPTCKRVALVKVIDYKSKTDIKHSLTAAQPEHQKQVNMYALLATRELAPVLRERGHEVDAVEVVELEIQYCDMARARRFTSAGPLTDAGKMTKRGRNPEYETLTLAPIEVLPPRLVERFIARRIEARLRGLVTLPPTLQGEAAWVCDWCPVRDICEARAQERGEPLPATQNA